MRGDVGFTHGIEKEIQVVKKDGTLEQDKEDKAIRDFENIMKYVPDKYKEIINLPGSKKKEGYRQIWRDQGWPTQLEISTRPCFDFVSLRSDLENLSTIVSKACKKADLSLIASGANPISEPEVGEYFGEHHHIGIASDEEKIYVYNMLRCFTGELIALTVNSPVRKGRAYTQKSYRIGNNPAVGPPQGVPYLRELTEEDFGADPRQLDITPFSNYPTVEIRFFDVQTSVCRSIGLAIILQALALKARRYLYKRKEIPEISQDIIEHNRTYGIRAGLDAVFRSDKDIENRFAYHGRGITRLRAREALHHMLEFIRPEIGELTKNLSQDMIKKSLNPIFASIYPKNTTKDVRNQQGGTLADWQLTLLNNGIDHLIEELANWTLKSSKFGVDPLLVDKDPSRILMDYLGVAKKELRFQPVKLLTPKEVKSTKVKRVYEGIVVEPPKGGPIKIFDVRPYRWTLRVTRIRQLS